MKREPIIINCARGTLVDTDALVEALAMDQISGAALDVIEGVPPFSPDNPLCQLDNVIITPHSAWYSEEALANLQRLAVEEVARVLKGERPKSLINPEVLSDWFFGNKYENRLLKNFADPLNVSIGRSVT